MLNMSLSVQFKMADCPSNTVTGLPSYNLIGTSKVSDVLTAPEAKSTDEKTVADTEIYSPLYTSSLSVWIIQADLRGTLYSSFR